VKFIVDAQLPYGIAQMLQEKGFDTIGKQFAICFKRAML